MNFKSRTMFICALAVALALAFAACSDDDNGGQVVSPINPNFLDVQLSVGYHCFCWDQKIDGQSAATGKYAIRMASGAYDNTWDFRIRSGIERNPAAECCDTATISIAKSQKDPPEFFGLAMEQDTVAWQDTVYFEIAVPTSARVQLEIKRTGN